MTIKVKYDNENMVSDKTTNKDKYESKINTTQHLINTNKN